MAATALGAEVIAMAVKGHLDAEVVIDVLNARSGGTHASRDKFPVRSFPRTFDYRIRDRSDGQGRAALPRRGQGARLAHA